MSYITLAELKSAIGESEVGNFTDSQLNSKIVRESTKINNALNTQVVREIICYINNFKTNKINGTNTTFYVRNWYGKWFSDTDDDGEVTITDVKVVSRATDGTETELTVSSIDNDNMGFTLSSAPDSDVKLFVTYDYSYFDMQTPNQNIKEVARYMCLSSVYFDLEFDLIGTSQKAGSISISGLDKNTKTHKYKNKADSLMSWLKGFGSSKRKPVTFNVARRRRYIRSGYLSSPNYWESPYNNPIYPYDNYNYYDGYDDYRRF